MHSKAGIILAWMLKFYKNKGADKIKAINIRELIEIHFSSLRLLTILSLVSKFITVLRHLASFIALDH